MTEKNKARQTNAANTPLTALFWACVLVVAVVPLVFSTIVYRIFIVPKFAALLVGAALILCLMCFSVIKEPRCLEVLKSKHVLFALAYIAVCSISTAVGVSPLASFFGSFQNEMGLLSRLCFIVCFFGLTVAIGSSRKRFIITVWLIAGIGSLIAVYAFLQFFEWDPFLKSSVYTEQSVSGQVVRVIGTLGHANYLGNFLLYTTPLTASLALAWKGQARRLATVGAAFSVAAIIFSGTRGAWLGLVVGAATLAYLESRKPKTRSAKKSKRVRIRIVIASAAVLVFLVAIILSPASRDVTRRARSFVEDRFTGAGRVLLWRDAVAMVPRFTIVGCGPEAFSREFLAYRSLALAQLAPQINNESSHNSYLDSAILFGLPGSILYAALIVSSFSLLLRARSRSANRRINLILGGLIGSLAAVVVHNFFIYDQIPTGLYFFIFNALALAGSNIKDGRTDSEEHPPIVVSTVVKLTGIVVAVLCAALLVAAVWVTASLVQADASIELAMAAAQDGDYQNLTAHGRRAIHSFDPTGAYNFQYASALISWADTVSARQGRTPPSIDLRKEALDAAIEQAQSSLAHTLMPDANYSLLAYLELRRGDKQKLSEYAAKAIDSDRYLFSAHWLMAEALIASGDQEAAMREAEFALLLNPSSSEARSALWRARGETPVVDPARQALVERVRLLLERGNFAKAEDTLQRTIRKSRGFCPDCYRELALMYEKTKRYSEATKAWTEYSRQAPTESEARAAVSRANSLGK